MTTRSWRSAICGQGAQAVRLQHRPGGVVGEAQEERPGARRDGRLHGVRVQLPAVLRTGGHEDRDAAREDDVRRVGDVRGLGHDDLVTGVHDGGEAGRQRLTRADGDDDLALRVVGHAVAPLDVLGQGAAQLDRPVVAGVVRAPGPQGRDARLHDHGRRVEVRLADAKADDVGHGVEDVEELADAGGRHLAHAPGQARTCGLEDGLAGHRGLGSAGRTGGLGSEYRGRPARLPVWETTRRQRDTEEGRGRRGRQLPGQLARER